MKRIAFLAALLIATTPLYAESMGEKTGVNSALGVTPSTADFVAEAATSDMFEIQSSQLAATLADPKAKEFAKTMVEDHTKTTGELKAMVASGKVNVALPTGPTKSQQSMLDKLKTEKGADFTKQYASDQVSAHKDAVSLFERYAKGGDNDALKTWANATLPKLREHLSMAQSLDK
jgi:putative membrane protein